MLIIHVEYVSQTFNLLDTIYSSVRYGGFLYPQQYLWCKILYQSTQFVTSYSSVVKCSITKPKSGSICSFSMLALRCVGWIAKKTCSECPLAWFPQCWQETSICTTSSTPPLDWWLRLRHQPWWTAPPHQTLSPLPSVLPLLMALLAVEEACPLLLQGLRWKMG